MEDFNFVINVALAPEREFAEQPRVALLVSRAEAIAAHHRQGFTWYGRSKGYALAGSVRDIVLPDAVSKATKASRRATFDSAVRWFEAYDEARAGGSPELLARERATEKCVHPDRAHDVRPYARGAVILDPGQSPGCRETVREWVRSVVGDEHQLLGGSPNLDVPYVLLAVPPNFAIPDCTIEELPQPLDARQQAWLRGGVRTEEIARADGRRAAKVAYIALRDAGFEVRDMRGQVDVTGFERQIAEAQAYGRSYRARKYATTLAKAKDGDGAVADLQARGVPAHELGDYAAALAAQVIHDAKVPLGVRTRGMVVAAEVAKREAHGLGRSPVDQVMRLPVRTNKGVWMPLDYALRSGAKFYCSEDHIRQNLGDWALGEGTLMIADPWRTKITFDNQGRWKTPRKNIGSIIAGIYGVGRPRKKDKKVEGFTQVLWWFDAAQRRQLLRDDGADIPLDFSAPAGVVKAIAADDPEVDAAPKFVNAVSNWLGPVDGIWDDDPLYNVKKAAIARVTREVVVDPARFVALMPLVDAKSARDWSKLGREFAYKFNAVFGYRSDGRMHARDPQIQALPSPLRPSVVIPEGHEVVDVDLTSAHVQIASVCANDEVLQRDLRAGVDLYEKFGRLRGLKRSDAKSKLLAWLNGNEDLAGDYHMSRMYPRLAAMVASYDRSDDESRSALARNWSEVEGRILSCVLVAMPAECVVVAPMHDGVVYTRPAGRTDLDAVVADLWRRAALLITATDLPWSVKIKVGAEWS